jgi:hypothetical protein
LRQDTYVVTISINTKGCCEGHWSIDGLFRRRAGVWP